MSSDGPSTIQRIGFVSTRVCGTDGVSLEIGKWAEMLQRMGYDCYYITGVSDRPADHTFLIEEVDLFHPAIQDIHRRSFGTLRRSRELSGTLRQLNGRIKDQLYEAVARFDLDLIIAQNSLTIPLNIPLGAALVEFLIETGLPCIAHHHDFAWERERFLVNSVGDYLRAAFPPPLAEIQHVVINSLAGREFSRRTGLSCRMIPNVMDFARPPEQSDGYADDFRQNIGVAEDDVLILQPTRVVARKGIQHTIELVRRLGGPPYKLVITHGANDEGRAYLDRVCQFAEMMGVEIVFAAPWIAAQRGTAPDGRKQYAIWDVYPQADLVAYPSTYEGFGNAFLEAIYYRKPIFCNRYSIYRTDIEPCGFEAIVMDGFLTDEVVRQVQEILSDPQQRARIVEHNYQVAQRYFSYQRLENELRAILSAPPPCICDGR